MTVMLTDSAAANGGGFGWDDLIGGDDDDLGGGDDEFRFPSAFHTSTQDSQFAKGQGMQVRVRGSSTCPNAGEGMRVMGVCGSVFIVLRIK